MYTKKTDKKYLAAALGVALGACMAATAWAAGQWTAEGAISAATAENLVGLARQGSDFPIDMNQAVLAELNHYLGSAKGRAYVAEAERNLALYRADMDARLAAGQLPEELLGVGFAESGFRNALPSANPQRAAGVWQFIPGTARNFGLRVDADVDDRLNVALETDAAFRLLEADQLRFQDWRLAIMAYNMGEDALDHAIQATGSRDPWVLVAKGYENDKNYLAKFMAAALILKNPQLLR